MWNVSGINISMTEGDYGIPLPMTIKGATISAQESVKITFKKQKNGNAILVKEYSFTNNTAWLEFTANESALFPVGQYYYTIDWYRNGVFLCNIVPVGSFNVGGKA